MGTDEYLAKVTRELIEARQKVGIDPYKGIYPTPQEIEARRAYEERQYDILDSPYPPQVEESFIDSLIDADADQLLNEALDELEFVTEEKKAIETQVGGDHYNKMGVQPFEATFANFGYDGLRAAVYTKVLKYLGRDKGDRAKHVEDIKKAIHCLQIQLEKAVL